MGVSSLDHTHFLRYPAPNSSVLDLSSLQHPSQDNYNPILTYGATKLCNILFALEIHRKYSGQEVSCNIVHPGNLLPTNLLKNAGLLYRAAVMVSRIFTNSLVGEIP